MAPGSGHAILAAMDSLNPLPARAPGTVHLLQAVGVLAWAMVAWAAWDSLPAGASRQAARGLLALFLAAFLLASRTAGYRRNDHGRRRTALAVQGLAALGLLALVPNNLVAVLATIAVSQLSWFYGLRTCVLTALAYLGLHYLAVAARVPQADALFATLVYGSFLFFALFATHIAAREQQGREALALVNSELKATQHLLGDSARQGERLRIARDLHDSLGHHLTALSLQLEIAGHLTDGEAKAQVDKARQLARLLLADVRAAVSELREEGGIDLRAALKALVADVPRLKVELAMPEDFAIDDAARAEALLRAAQEALTNTLRHAEASAFSLSLEHADGAWRLRAADDGRGAADFVPGNGLKGLRERVLALGGRLDWQSRPGQGFRLELNLPEPPA